MSKEMLINVSEGEECRIALVENGRLEELYMERTSSTSHVGNVYKGRVTNVEPSIQAAFVDFGLGRNGFLHISDLMPTYFGGKAEEVKESVGRKMARRDRPPIQRCLKRGDEIIVQIIKEGIGTKGPTLSTYVSIPGRILVMMPGMSKLGVSRKIEDEEERKRLRTILDGLKPPKDCGFIIRTAGIGKSKTEIERDLKYLTRLFEVIKKKSESDDGPVELYAEGDLVTRTVRDVMTSDVERIVVDNKDVARKIKEFFKIAAPRTKNKVDVHDGPVPLFHAAGIEKEIELMYSRHVPLPSGGSLVIDSTEAIVAIDVNSGKFRDHADAETTAYKTDLEAADEIPRQLRLRDLGGVIICDFIDLRFERHRRDLEKRLHENLKADRAKTKMLRMSQFGIIEMTRQRMRPSLKRSIYFDCPHCKGAGLVKTPESMSLDVMRRLAIAAHDDRVLRIDLAVSNEVAFYLQNRKRDSLAGLEKESGKRIVIRADATLALDEMKMDLFDDRDGLVFIAELGMAPAEQEQGGRGRDGRRGGRRDGRERGRRGGRGGGREQGREGGRGRQHREAEEGDVEDRYDVESVEDQVDQREEERDERAEADAAVEAPISSMNEGEIDAPPEPLGDEPADEPVDEVEDVNGSEEESSEGPAPEDSEEEPFVGEAQDDAEEQPREPQRQDRSPRSEQSDDDYDQEEVELQPRGSPMSAPNPKQGRRGQRGGGGRGRGGGRRQQEAPMPQEQLGGPRRDNEMSLAERWALEEAAEKQKQRGQHRPQQPQQHQPNRPQPQHHQQGPRDQGPRDQQGPRDDGGYDDGGGGGRRRRRRRRRRGGGGGGGGFQNGDGPQHHQGGGQGGDRQQNQQPRQHQQPRQQQPRPQQSSQPQPPVERTGSTDRHLVRDEPVLPQPTARPRNYRDLDHIPDDYD